MASLRTQSTVSSQLGISNRSLQPPARSIAPCAIKLRQAARLATQYSYCPLARICTASNETP
eukprot:2766117-Rhodomonas_salina.4